MKISELLLIEAPSSSTTVTKFMPWHIRDEVAILRMIDYKQYGLPSDFKVLKDGSVRVLKHSTSWGPRLTCPETDEGLKGMPFKFASCKNFIIKSELLEDARGIPEKGDYLTLQCSVLKNVKGVIGQYKTSIAFKCPDLTSFECNVQTPHVFINDVRKFDVKSFVSSFTGTSDGLGLGINSDAVVKLFYKKPVLTLLKAKPFLKNVNIGFTISPRISQEQMNELRKVFDIVQKHSASKDILKCQIELIENDLEEYAQL